MQPCVDIPHALEISLLEEVTTNEMFCCPICTSAPPRMVTKGTFLSFERPQEGAAAAIDACSPALPQVPWRPPSLQRENEPSHSFSTEPA